MTSVDLKPSQQSHLRPPARLSRQVLLGLLLAVAVIAVYYPVHSQPFANYDDADYVTDNIHVRSGLNWQTVRWAMTTRDAANWHPVTWISHALDTQMFGVTPSGPHDVNVLIHILNALLLCWVLQRATGYVGRSWMVAALFALHPANVESVAWIAERKNVLSMLFFLLTLGAYRWYAEKPRAGRYLVVAALFGLGLMTKPQVITLPFVLLLWDYWPLGRIAFRSSPFALRQTRSSEFSGESQPLSREEQFSGEKRIANSERRSSDLGSLLWEKAPLLAMCGISASLTLRAQAAGGATSVYHWTVRLQNAIVSYARYLAKAFWPARLALFYPYPAGGFKMWQVGAAALLLLAITAAVALAYRRRYLSVGWLWFLGTMVPMIGLVQVGTQAMADRYAYLPFVGLFIMVCWLAAEAAEALPVSRALLPAVSVAVLAALALASHRQVEYWNDHVTLWQHTLDVTRNNWVAENNLGTALLKMGKMEEAIPHFRVAVALYPDDPNSNLNIGTYEQTHGNYAAAIERYKTAVGLARNYKVKARAYNNLGYAYKDIGDYPDACKALQSAVQVDPEYVGAWVSLGLMAQRNNDLPLAISAYRRAMQIQGSDFGYLLLSQALEKSGELQQARAAREKAEHLSNDIISAQRRADQLLRH